MKNRRNSGSITTFSVAIFFLILMLGSFSFYFMRQLSGGRELEHACDAGVLNAARSALLTPSVKLSEIDATALPAVRDFFALSVPPNSSPTDFTNPISLLTYNRLIAQCMLVTNNAEAEGSPAAIAHAREVIHAAQAVGLALRNKMLTGGGNNPLNPAFLAVSQVNPLEGFVSKGANISLVNDVTCHWLRYNASANIYLDPNTMVSATPQDASHPSAPPPTNDGIPPAGISMDYYKTPLAVSRPSMTVEYFPQLGYSPINPFTAAYVQGYAPLLLLGNYGAPEILTAVPTMPQQEPHLVSLQHFNEPNHLVGPDLYSPPNSVGATCKSSDNAADKSKVASTTLAAALIGSLSKDFSALGTPNTDYVASIPAGYITVVNEATAVQVALATGFNPPVPTGNLYAGANDLFNTEGAGGAAPGPGIYVSEEIATQYGKASVFSTELKGSTTILKAWETFAKSSGSENVLGKMLNANDDPLGAGQSALLNATSVPDPNILVAVASPTLAPPADLQTLLNLKSQGATAFFEIKDANMTNLPKYISQQLVDLVATALGRGTTSTAGSKGSYSDIVTYAKDLLMDVRHATSLGVTIDIPIIGTLETAFSGMQYYPRVSNKNPNPAGGKDKFAYLIHYSQYAAEVAPTLAGNKVKNLNSSEPYVKDGTPAQYLSVINTMVDGPLPTLTKNSKGALVPTVYSDEPSYGPQNHTFNQDSPSFNNFLAPIVARCAQIVPGTTRQQVLDVLGFSDITKQPDDGLFNTSVPVLKMGETWYLHANPNNPKQLVYDQNVPYADLSLQPDSVQAANGIQNNTPYMTGNYAVCGGDYKDSPAPLNSLINTAADGTATAPVGDMGYHAMPDLDSPGLLANDAAFFVPSSGYANFLGQVHFQTTLQPVTTPTYASNANLAVTFSKPN